MYFPLEQHPLLPQYVAPGHMMPFSLQFTTTPMAPSDFQMMDSQTRAVIFTKILQRIKVTKIVMIVIGVIVSLVGAAMMLPALSHHSDVFMISGGSVLASGLFLLFLWGFIIFLARKNEQLIKDTLSNSNNVVAEWVYMPNQEFQNWRKIEWGFRGPQFRAILITCAIFVICGFVLTLVNSFVGGLGTPLFSFLIWGTPYLGGAFVMLLIGVIFVAYHLNESLKPWKHSVILFNNGFIYYYGSLYQLRRYGSYWVQPINAVAIENRIYDGHNLTLMTMKSSTLASTLRIYVPESLRGNAQQWVFSHPTVA